MSIELERKRINLANVRDVESSCFGPMNGHVTVNQSFIELLDAFPGLSFGLTKSIYLATGEDCDQAYSILRNVVNSQVAGCGAPETQNGNKRAWPATYDALDGLREAESICVRSSQVPDADQKDASDAGQMQALLTRSVALLVSKVTVLKGELHKAREELAFERQMRLSAERKQYEVEQSMQRFLQNTVMTQQQSQVSYNALASGLPRRPGAGGGLC